MGVDDRQSTEAGRDEASSPKLASCLASAERLARTRDADRDLAWHVAAFYLGDLTALVSARLREIQPPLRTA